jgi:hypothetical protein
MKRRISTAMMVSGTLLLLLSMIFSTVSFAAPDFGVPAAPQQVVQTCSNASPPECRGEDVGHEFIQGGQCKMCAGDAGEGGPTVHCHVAACPEEPECTNGDTRSCDTGQLGVCADGTETCVDGQWSGACNQDTQSSAEVCDGLDNDCDGEVDEGGVCDECTSGDTRSCETGQPGVCAEGTETCVSGQWSGVCNQDTQSSTEVCDGLDNDCDGQVDEGGVCDECTSGDTRPCDTGQPGVCADGTETCVSGEWSGVCNQDTQSSTEVCDGLDNDCDGQVDEGGVCDECTSGDTRPCDTGQPGVCADGTETCVSGEWSGVCDPDTQSSAEVCDGLDNDCDGSTDEGLGTSTCGLGECQVTVDNCIDGQEQTCVPGDPIDEICGDGLDNDCDGEVDEGCECAPEDTQACYSGPTGTEGVGVCEAGTQTCSSEGQWGACVGDTGPSTEVCDGLDNDCDGSTDEGFGTTTCGVGECRVTVKNCVDGELQECVPGTPGTEICDDDLDNDCDGSVDEGCGTPREPRERDEPSPPAQVSTPTPSPTVVVEVLAAEELPETGFPPLAPVFPTLPMTLSALALIAGGLILRETGEKE